MQEIKEETLEALINKFVNHYKVSQAGIAYLKELIKLEDGVKISNDAKLTMVVQEVGFFIKEYQRSANMFRFTNDLLNKDRARVINDQLHLLHKFFVFLLEQVHYKESIFCDENTLTLLFESVTKMEKIIERYSAYIFQ
jgi:hypothetical protein